MKKRLVTLLAGLLTVLSMGFGLAQFSDVPAGHWAKEAVEAMVAKGIISGFPDGTFRGNATLTRYQAALIIYRLLQQIEEELKAKGTSPTMEAMSSEDIEALKNAVQELAAELAALGVRVSALEDSAATKDDIARLEALIEELKAKPAPEPGMDQAALQDLMDRVEAASIAADTALAQAQQLAEQLEALAQDVEKVKGDVAALQDLMDRVEAASIAADTALAQAQRLAEQLEALAQDVEGVKGDVAALQDLMDRVEAASIAADTALAQAQRLAEQLEALAQDVEGVKGDVAALQDLMDRVEAASIAADTALAQAQQLAEQLEALAQDVEGVKGDVAALGTQVEANAQAIQALNELAVLLNQDVLSLQDQVKAASIAADTALAQAQRLAEQLQALSQDVEGVKGDVAALGTQVEANAQAIQALNELAVLLNQDVLSLQDRVTALEKGLADLQGVDFEQFAAKEDVAAVQEFAAALRSDLVGLSEKVSKLEGTVGDLSGKVATLQRNAFTISGSLSLSYEVFAGSGKQFDIDRVFSSNFSTGDGSDPGTLVVDEVDLGQNAEGATTATLSLTLKANALDAKSSPGGYNAYSRLVAFSLTGSVTNPASGTTYGPLNLTVDSVSTTLAVARDQALSFSFGRSVRTKFSEYVFDNDEVSYGHGFVATFKPGVLGATLTGVYASKGGSNGDNLYARGAGLTLAPMEGISLGGAVVQQGSDILGGSATTVYGANASLKLGPLGLSGEYFASDAAPNANGYYVRGSADLGLVKVEGNYRNIGAGVTPANMLSYDADPANKKNAAPFHADQQGYGAKATLGLGPLSLTGFYDTYTGTGARTYYGGEAAVKFSGFTLEGYYRVADNGNNGTPDDSAAAETAANNNYASSGLNYTQFGVRLSHNGAAQDALIKNLTLTAAYDVRPQFAPGARTDIAVYGTYSVEVAILKATLLGRYHSQAVAGSPAQSYTTVKYGVKAETQPLAIVLKPSLMGEYVARSTQGGTANNAEAKYAVGLKLGEFLFPNSSLEVKYGSYQGQNIGAVLTGNAEGAWDASSDVLYNGNVNVAGINGSVTGFYVTWSYWDLVFSYADFIVDNNGSPEFGRGFKISYTVKF